MPIHRIYNRVIFDEVERKGLDLSHIFQRDLVDVTWVGHPNWYLKISKFSLPFIKSRYCPPTWFVSDLEGVPGGPGELRPEAALLLRRPRASSWAPRRSACARCRTRRTSSSSARSTTPPPSRPRTSPPRPRSA